MDGRKPSEGPRKIRKRNCLRPRERPGKEKTFSNSVSRTTGRFEKYLSRIFSYTHIRRAKE